MQYDERAEREGATGGRRLAKDVHLDTLADYELRRRLANIGDINTGEAVHVLQQEGNVDVRWNRT